MIINQNIWTFPKNKSSNVMLWLIFVSGAWVAMIIALLMTVFDQI